MSIELLTTDILVPSIISGCVIASFVFLLGLGIMFCLKLFNS